MDGLGFWQAAIEIAARSHTKQILRTNAPLKSGGKRVLVVSEHK
jgi:hypothetical protein